MSVNATNAIPTAAGISLLKSSNATSGHAEGGQPAGTEPTTATSSASPNSATTAVAPTTATNTPGTFGATRRSRGSRRATPTPIASAVELVSSSPLDEPAQAREEVLGVDREAEQLGQLRTITVTAMPIR